MHSYTNYSTQIIFEEEKACHHAPSLVAESPMNGTSSKFFLEYSIGQRRLQADYATLHQCVTIVISAIATFVYRCQDQNAPIRIVIPLLPPRYRSLLSCW